MRSKLANRSRSGATVSRLAARPLQRVRRALAGDLDRRAERGRRLVPRPELVELVRDVRQHDALRSRLAPVLAGLARGQVAALAAALGARQRGLDQQQVAVARELDELLGRPA